MPSNPNIDAVHSFLTSHFSLLTSLQEPLEPIIVSIEQEKSELTGLSDILIGALGLSGLLLLGSILAAVGFAAILFWLRMRFGKDTSETAPRITDH